MLKRIGLSAAALLAAIALTQTPASAENRNQGAYGFHTSSVQNHAYERYGEYNQRDDTHFRVRDDRLQTERHFQTHRFRGEWNRHNFDRW